MNVASGLLSKLIHTSTVSSLGVAPDHIGRSIAA